MSIRKCNPLISGRVLVMLSLFCVILAPTYCAAKEPVEIKVEVGVGPAYNSFFGSIPNTYDAFYGSHIHLTGVVDQSVVKRYKKKIPKKFRKQVLKSKEVKYRPGILAAIPTTIIVTPSKDRSAYGAVWDLIGGGLSLGPLGVGASLQASYLYLRSGEGEAKLQTHFLRPSLALKAYVPIQLTESFGLSLSWVSSFTVPQPIGGSPLDVELSREGTLWHMGQAYLSLNFRFPYEVKL